MLESAFSQFKRMDPVQDDDFLTTGWRGRGREILEARVPTRSRREGTRPTQVIDNHVHGRRSGNY